MLKADANATPSKPWTKVHALTSFIQLKSNNSSAAPAGNNTNDDHVPFVSHSNTGHHEQQETQEQQPKADRLKIFIGTWNMYGRLLDIDLEPFLTTRHPSPPSRTWPPSSTSQPDSDQKLVEHDKQNGESPFLDSSTAHPYHLLAIGTQECERDISESLFYPSKEAWEQRLGEYLGDQYKMVRCETLAALHLAVFVNKKFANYVKNVHSADIKTGWANMVGNKGAVAVSLDFGSQSLLFINCHLRAHQSKLAERNANVHRILHELQIKGGKPMHAPSSSSSPTNPLFHLPSLRKHTHPASSTKSTKSVKSTKLAKSIDEEEPLSKSKTAEHTKPSATLENNNTSMNVNATKSDNGDGSLEKDDKQSVQNGMGSSAQQQVSNGAAAPVATININTPADTKTSSPSNKRSSDNTSKSQKKRHSHSHSDKRKSLASMQSSSASLTSASAEEQHSVTERFDHTFIFGDTNYRINADRQFVLDTIKKQDFKTLLKYDQLTLERQQNTTPLAVFNEHPINFIPTYKFDAIDAISTDSSSSAASSSSSLPILPTTATTNTTTTTTPGTDSEQQENKTTSSPASAPPAVEKATATTPATATLSESSESSELSESFVITPKNSLHNSCSVSVRYDTSPKQRIPSWTDRILWHDRHHTHHHHHHQQQGSPIPQASPIPTTTTSSPAMTTQTTTTSQPQPMKSKKNLKWIGALKRKDKNTDVLDKGLVDPPLVDKNTVCYHYDTVMDPRLMGVSDHLPVIGVFGVWFDEWENGTYKRAKSIKSFKKKIPLWRKWLL